MSGKIETIDVDGQVFYICDASAKLVEKAISQLGLPQENPRGNLAEVCIRGRKFYVMPNKAKNSGKLMPSSKIIGEIIRIFGGSLELEKVRKGPIKEIVPRRNFNLNEATEKYVERHKAKKNKTKCKVELQAFNLYKIDQAIISPERAEAIVERLNDKEYGSEDFMII